MTKRILILTLVFAATGVSDTQAIDFMTRVRNMQEKQRGNNAMILPVAEKIGNDDSDETWASLDQSGQEQVNSDENAHVVAFPNPQDNTSEGSSKVINFSGVVAAEQANDTDLVVAFLNPPGINFSHAEPASAHIRFPATPKHNYLGTAVAAFLNPKEDTNKFDAELVVAIAPVQIRVLNDIA